MNETAHKPWCGTPCTRPEHITPRIPVEVIDAIRVRLAEEFGCVSIDDIAAVDVSDTVADVLTELVTGEYVDDMHDRIVPWLLRGR